MRDEIRFYYYNWSWSYTFSMAHYTGYKFQVTINKGIMAILATWGTERTEPKLRGNCNYAKS